MRAMLLEHLGPVDARTEPLRWGELPDPVAGPGELVLRVSACGVCHTELDEIEGRTPPPRLPVVPGHQVVGRVAAAGPGVTGIRPGERVGVAWIFSACGTCAYCRSGRENLCAAFRATGRDAHGGYAEQMRVAADFVFPIPAALTDAEAAPLLCAGAIGHRSLELARLEEGAPLGLMGFGASAHLVLQMARRRYPASRISVWARSPVERDFARDLGAAWAGDIAERPPEPPLAIIDTTPAWTPVVAALSHLAPGGRLVINAIRKEAGDQAVLLTMDYATHLWQEKVLQSVANVTRRDVAAVLALAVEAPLRPTVECFPLEAANRALQELRQRRIRGAKVLVMG
jgi:propanol-preferring alcohol dehydrogenase